MSEVGDWREGTVESINPDGSATIRWADGTTSVLKKSKPPASLAPWIEAVRQNGKCGDRMCACQTLNLEESQNGD